MMADHEASQSQLISSDEEDEELLSQESNKSKRRKKRKLINMPKSPAIRRKLHQLAVQHLKSHIDNVVSSPEEDSSSSEIEDIRKPRGKRVSQITLSQQSQINGERTNNNMNPYSVYGNMIETMYPNSQGSHRFPLSQQTKTIVETATQSVKSKSSISEKEAPSNKSIHNETPLRKRVNPFPLKKLSNKFSRKDPMIENVPSKKVKTKTKTDSKNHISSVKVLEIKPNNKRKRSIPNRMEIVPGNEKSSRPIRTKRSSSIILSQEIIPAVLPKPYKKVVKKFLNPTSKVVGPICKGIKCGPPPCSQTCPRWRTDAHVLLNCNLLSEKMLKEAAKQSGQELTPDESQKLLTSINPFLENMFDELCEETPLAFGVWGFQAFKEKCKEKGFFKGKDASDADISSKIKSSLKNEKTKEAADGILYPKNRSKDTLSSFDFA